MAKLTFTVDVTEEDDGSYWAEVRELPGCFASGFSVPELREALIEAIQMCLPDGIVIDTPIWSDEEPEPDTGKRQMLVCA